MISRRNLLISSAALGVLGANPLWAKEKSADFVLGKDYLAVNPIVECPARPIIVHDFFAYTCSHCYRLAPLMSEFVKSVEGDSTVKVIPVPVSWEESYNYFPAVYFAFEALGRLSDLHMAYWQWVMQPEHPWTKVEDVKPDTDAWVKEHGINLEKWHALIESFAIRNKVRQATEIWQKYDIDSTPMIGVAGRFLTAPHLTGSRPKAIEATRWLIGQIKSGKL